MPYGHRPRSFNRGGRGGGNRGGRNWKGKERVTADTFRPHAGRRSGSVTDSALEKSNIGQLISNSSKGNLAEVQKLIGTSRKMANKTYQGTSPLTEACRGGHPDVVKYLIQHGARLDVTNSEPPIIVAIENEHSEVLDILLSQRRYNPNIVSPTTGTTPLHAAATFNNVKAASRLTSVPNVQVDIVDRKGSTPLQVAAFGGNLGVARVLLRQRQNINFQNLEGATALHLACAGNQIEIARILVQFKADIDILDHKNLSAIHLACRNGNAPLVAYLLQQNAQVDTLSIEKETLLHAAVRSQSVETVKLLSPLVKMNPRLANPDKTGIGPIHEAVISNNPHILQIFIDNPDLDLNPLGPDAETPLFIAAAEGRYRLVKMLLLAKDRVDINMPATPDKNSPLQIAVIGKHTNVVNALIKFGADINFRNKRNDTAAEIAAGIEWPEGIELLKQDPESIQLPVLKKLPPPTEPETATPASLKPKTKPKPKAPEADSSVASATKPPFQKSPRNGPIASPSARMNRNGPPHVPRPVHRGFQQQNFERPANTPPHGRPHQGFEQRPVHRESYSDRQRREEQFRNMRRGDDEDRYEGFHNCQACSRRLPASKISRCSVCASAFYCGRECQTRDWERHRQECVPRT